MFKKKKTKNRKILGKLYVDRQRNQKDEGSENKKKKID